MKQLNKNKKEINKKDIKKLYKIKIKKEEGLLLLFLIWYIF